MRIVVLDDYADALRSVVGLEALAGHAVSIHRDAAAGPDALAARLADAEIALIIQQRTPMSAAVLERLPALRLIVQTGRNLDHLDIDACTRLGIRVAAGGKGSLDATAELTWALILAWARDIPAQIRRLQEGRWLDSVGRSLVGRTLGIYAPGRIGTLVGRVGAAFGMRVICWGRDASRARAAEAGFAFADSREAFFAGADVLSLHLPLNAATRGIVTPNDLAAMKPGALLVNTSRAGIVAPGALVSALRAGRPGFAAVDVFEHEPVLDADHPLLSLSNALCTPHLGYSAEDSYRGLLEWAVEQMLAFARGEPLDLVDAPETSR